MTLRVVFHALAEIELNEAAQYYQQESAGLGVSFLIEIERAVEFVREHPSGSVLVATTVRSKRVRRFPYSIIYSVRPDHVRILAVMNQRRRPFYWRDRLE